MATSSQISSATADGAVRATPSLQLEHGSTPAVGAQVEAAVIVTDELSSSPARYEEGSNARDGSDNADKRHGTNGSARLHLTAISSSPSASSPNTPTSGSRPKPERPTSIVPVFWQRPQHASRASVTSLTSVGITLTDNTGEPANDDSPLSPSGLQSPLWARQVDIDEFVKIEGDVPGVGGYIVWLVKVQTLDGGGSIVLRKRYSEFEALRTQLAATFPRAGEALPGLPPKSVFYKFRSSFLEKRRIGLAYFLNCILLNPEFSGSPAVREFIFATD